MWSIEKKILNLVEKHMLLLAVLLMSLLGLYLRKVAVWWNYTDIVGYFDYHDNYTQSALYYVLLRVLEHLPLVPLHSMKWLAGLSDYVLALVCAMTVYTLPSGENDRDRRLTGAFCYIGCIFSPVIFLRGIVWAQIDSLAMVLLMCAYLLWNKKKEWLAAVPAVLAVTLYPCLFWIVLVYIGLQQERLTGLQWAVCGGVLAGSICLQGFSGMLLGEGFAEAAAGSLRWLTYHPITGMEYGNVQEWLLQLVNYYGLPAAVISGLAAAKRKLSGVAALGITIVIAVIYGSCLF